MAEFGETVNTGESTARKRTAQGNKSAYATFQAQHFGKMPPQAVDLEEAVLRQQMQHKDAAVADQLPGDSISKFDI